MMKEKKILLKVSDCNECLFKGESVEIGGWINPWCKRKDKKSPTDGIPGWCPLEDWDWRELKDGIYLCGPVKED